MSVQNVKENINQRHNQVDFNKILETEFEELNKATKVAKHDYHTFTFATIDSNTPQQRTVVLRSFDKRKNEIAFHSDIRSPKLNHIQLNCNVSALFYDKVRKIQLRIIGKAVVTRDDDELKKIWCLMKPDSKLCYMGPFSPSEKLDYFQPNLPIHDANNIDVESNEFGFRNFCRIKIKMKSIEWLKLSYEGHKRILFHFTTKAQPQWLAT